MFIIRCIILIICVILAIFLSDLLFRKLQNGTKKIHLAFFARMTRILIILIALIVFISWFVGFDKLWRIVFSSSVVLGGIIGFAAQGIIKDILAGLMLSVRRPFEIGDRILLSDIEKPSVVEDITISHTILKTMDNIRYIIPNSELNSKIITNTSYHQRLRGSFIKINIAYTSDINKAIIAVREAVKSCPYTFPNNPKNEDLGGYGEVYMMGFSESALLLETVIWTEPETDNFLACSEVRMAIIGKFRENGVEIPYNYVNVITHENHPKPAVSNKPNISTNVGSRNTKIKTDPIHVRNSEKSIEKIYSKVHEFSVFHNLTDRNENKIRLLSEELINFMKQLLGELNGNFWLEGSKNKIRINLQLETQLDNDKHIKLIGISSSGSNEATRGFIGKLREMIALYPDLNELKGQLSYQQYKKSDNYEEDLEKVILTSLADDIKVSIINGSIKVSVFKKMN